MTRGKAWVTAGIVTVGLVSLVLLVGATFGHFGFNGSDASGFDEAGEQGSSPAQTSFVQVQEEDAGQYADEDDWNDRDDEVDDWDDDGDDQDDDGDDRDDDGDDRDDDGDDRDDDDNGGHEKREREHEEFEDD